MLKLVFEWKHEMPIGEINLVTPPEPLDETTDVVLVKESSEQNRRDKAGDARDTHRRL